MVDLGHRIRSSDASSFDEICDICGATDRAGSDALKRPCAPMSNPQRTTDAGCVEKAVMVCPQCEGEGSYPDGLDEAACNTDCTRCGSNGWIVDVAALSASGGDAAELAAADMREAAAARCESVEFGIELGEWMAMTKKELSARACHECAAAIRALPLAKQEQS